MNPQFTSDLERIFSHVAQPLAVAVKMGNGRLAKVVGIEDDYLGTNSGTRFVLKVVKHVLIHLSLISAGNLMTNGFIKHSTMTNYSSLKVFGCGERKEVLIVVHDECKDLQRHY